MKSPIELLCSISKAIEKQYPSLNDPHFLEDKYKDGCVIRAFSYAVGVEASDREYAMRLRQRRASERKINPAHSASFQSILEEDDKAWKRLIKGIRRTKTSFGRALSDFKIIENQLTEKQIRTALERGERIIVYESFHVSCVDIGIVGNLNHVSDKNAPPLCYDQGKPIRVFRLMRR